MKAKIIFMALIGLISFNSCEKEEDKPEEPASNNTTTSTPTFNDADAVLVAINSVSSAQGIPFTFGSAVAVFFNANKDNVSVGTVKVNGDKNLDKNANNSYTFTVSPINPTGLSFSNDIPWSVSGDNGFSAFNTSSTQGMPVVGSVNANETVDKNKDYSLSTGTISNADSVIYLVGGLTKTVAASVKSVTFTVSEMSSLKAGASVVSITPYNYTKKVIDSKNIYLVNQVTTSKTVTIK